MMVTPFPCNRSSSDHLLSWVLVAIGVLLPLPDLGVALRDVLRRPAGCFQVGLPVVVGLLVADAHKLGNAESRSAEQESNHAAKDGDRHDDPVLPCLLVPLAGRGPVFSGPNAGQLRPSCRRELDARAVLRRFMPGTGLTPAVARPAVKRAVLGRRLHAPGRVTAPPSQQCVTVLAPKQR